ncbi:MAG: DUF1800 family protein [Planctomycetes bacterium]|nr:DUF1800 family protein [Planctomycetota bacterium]
MSRTPSFLRFAAAGLFVAALLWTLRPGAAADAPRVLKVCDRTVAEAGRTRVIAFRLAEPAAEDTAPAAAVADGSVLAIEIAPAVLKGESLGYLRVRGLKPGKTTLTVGDASMTVDVVAERAPDAPRLEITSPADGARVWRKVAVGVEVDAEAAGAGATHELRLSTGASLKPSRVSGPIWGPTLRILYLVNTFKLPEGPLEMTPVAKRTDGTELAGATVVVHVLKPEPGDIVQMEAEDQRDVKRPKRFGEALLNVAPDADASGHQMVPMYGSDPAACFPFKVEKSGWYQVVITARGSFAGGAFPTVGLIVDGAFEHVTNARLLDEQWHRVALGVPVRLARGDRFLTPYFLNDFYAPGVPADRNYFLDMIEIVRVEERPSAGGGEGSDSGTGGAPIAIAEGRDAWNDVRVAFAEPLNGRLLTGTVEVNGAAVWKKMEKAPAPRVTLKVNGEAVGTQRSAAPKWWVDPGWFEEGANTLQLVAVLDGGETASTPVQTMTYKPPKTWKRVKPLPFLRFPVREEAWDDVTRKAFTREGDCPEKVSAKFFSNGKATLALPEALSGAFLIWVEGRGDQLDGPPIAEVSLVADGKTTKIGEIGIGGWWGPHQVPGIAVLPAGAKKLVVAFTNDKFEKDKGDRNLALQAVILLGVPPTGDTLNPSVKIAWPPDGHEVWMADVVVVEPSDDRVVAWVELEIDGKRTGIRADTLGKFGRVVLPLLARQLAPGEHKLAVRLHDGAHERVGKARTFVVPAAGPQAPGRFARAVHLLNRFAYGPDPEELAAVLTMGETAWLDDRLARGLDDPGDASALLTACVTFGNDDGEYDAMGRDAYHALLTPNPVRTRFVRWVDNHFNTWIRKVAGRAEWEERKRFTRLGIAPFPDLLRASSTSPTMLQYLDQQFSFARSLNENYAREICELHTAGVHGGYSQADVTALANLLTGWTYSDEGDGRSGGFQLRRRTHRFDPALSDGRPQTFFGMRFPKAAPEARHDRARLAIELLAAHPSTARFVCGKLVAHYVRWPAPERMTEDLAAVFLETDGDMRAVLRAMAAHPDFWAESRTEKVATPFDFSTRLSRACGFKLPWQVIDMCARSGAGLYDRATPDGYQEEDTAWTSTNAMLQRWKFARDCEWALAAVVPGAWRWSQEPMTAEWRQELVDLVAVRLIGRTLSKESNEAALQVLEACRGGRDAVAMQAASFVAQLPEANLR